MHSSQLIDARDELVTARDNFSNSRRRRAAILVSALLLVILVTGFGAWSFGIDLFGAGLLPSPPPPPANPAPSARPANELERVGVAQAVGDLGSGPHRFKGSINFAGKKVGVDYIIGGDGAEGSGHVTAGALAAKFVVLDHKAYVRANEDFWSAVSARPGTDKWVRVPDGEDAMFANLLAVDPQRVVRMLAPTEGASIAPDGSYTTQDGSGARFDQGRVVSVSLTTSSGTAELSVTPSDQDSLAAGVNPDRSAPDGAFEAVGTDSRQAWALLAPNTP